MDGKEQVSGSEESDTSPATDAPAKSKPTCSFLSESEVVLKSKKRKIEKALSIITPNTSRMLNSSFENETRQQNVATPLLSNVTTPKAILQSSHATTLVHPGNPPNKLKNYSCRKCKKQFYSLKYAKAHHVRKHPREKRLSFLALGSMKNVEFWVDEIITKQVQPTPSLTHQFHCIFCKNKYFPFSQKRQFRNHLYQDLKFKRYGCEHCAEQFFQIKDGMIHHQKEHSSDSPSFIRFLDVKNVQFWVNGAIKKQLRLSGIKKRIKTESS